MCGAGSGWGGGVGGALFFSCRTSRALQGNRIEFKRGVNRPNGPTDPDSIFARISDLEQNFNGFADPAIAAVCGFHRFFGPGV